MKNILSAIVLCFAVTTVLSQSPANHTPKMFRSATGPYSAEGYKPIGDVKWKFKTDGKIFSSPAVFKGLVFIGSEDGNLYAVNELTGLQEWKFKTGGAVHSSPFVTESSLYFGSMDGYFYSIDLLTGKEKWKFATGGEKVMGDSSYWGMKPSGMYMEDLWDCFLSSPVVETSGGRSIVFFGSSDGHLYAVNAADGSLVWKFKTNASIHSSPALHDGTVYVGSWDGCLYALDSRTGFLKWKFQTGQQMGMTGIQASPTISNGTVYFGARDAHLYALNASSGAMLWKYDAKNAWIVGSAVVHDSTVYAGTSDSYLLVAVDARTGRERFRFKTGGYIFGSPAVRGTTAYVGDFTGRVYAIDLASAGKRFTYFSTEARNLHAGSVLNKDTLDFRFTANGADLSFYFANKKVMDDFYSLGSVVSSPTVMNDVMYFGSADGYLYALKLKNRKRKVEKS